MCINNIQIFKDASSEFNHMIVYNKKNHTFEAADQAGKNQKICTLSEQLFSIHKLMKNASPEDQTFLKDYALEIFDHKHHMKVGTRSIWGRIVSATKNLFSGYGLNSSDTLVKKIQRVNPQTAIHTEVNFDTLKAEADAGNPEKQYLLAKAYNKAAAICANPALAKEFNEKAFSYYLLAADQDHPEATFEVGKCYHIGKGVVCEPGQAEYFMGIAAQQGLADAQYLLGHIFTYKKDYEVTGVNFLIKAAAQNHKEALWDLSRCYANGTGVDADIALSNEYAARAEALAQ